MVSSLPIVLIIRLNIHSWGDLTSRYNSPSVMISASLPSAPVRSNLRPLQEAIIRWGKSYVSLTMLHFHHNSSHSLPANSYLLQTIRVYCSCATSLPAPRFSNTHTLTHTRTALCMEADTLAGRFKRKTMNVKQEANMTDCRSVSTLLLKCVKGNVHWVSSVFRQFRWI